MDMTDEELSAEYDRLFKEFSGRDPPRDDEGTFDDLLTKANSSRKATPLKRDG